MPSRISAIYIILNTKTNKVYIGQSQDIRTRWSVHKAHLIRNCHHNRYLQASWNKHGADVFAFQILEYCPVNKLNEREQHYLDIYLKKGVCYNVSIDAIAPMRGRTHKHSESTKLKMSRIAKGRVFSTVHRQRLSDSQRNRASPSIETRTKISLAIKNRPPMSDATKERMSVAARKRIHAPLSEETKRKIGDAHRGKIGKIPTEETRIKISIAGKGRKHTPEARAKISEALKKRVMSDETRQKIGKAHKGKSKPPLSIEAREKISEALKGRPKSEETRKKLSEAAKRQHERQRQLKNKDE